MPQVFYSPYFVQSFEQAATIYGADLLMAVVADFVRWKSWGHNPSRLTDKPSSKDDKGRVFRPYEQNSYRHVSFNLRAQGDPVLAFRMLPNNDVMIVCITSKHAMFGRKDDFVKNHSGEFPNPKP